MIAIRSEREIEMIRSAGRITAITLEKLKAHVKAGVKTEELDKIALSEIVNQKAVPAFKGYKGYPACICVSINEGVVHGIPSKRKLKDGDIISIDLGVKFGDYYADAAITVGVGKVSEEADRLMTVTRKALEIGVSRARAGRRLSEVSEAIQDHVEKSGFSVVRAFVGHGIGTKIHEEPEIPNYGSSGSGPRLQTGMILAIEPMVNQGSFEVEVLEDGWTAVTKDRKLSAHFEHTIAVMGDEAAILTA